jgi:hypothetical protein
MAGMTLPLHNWAISQVVDRAVDNISDLNRMLAEDNPDTARVAKTWLRKGASEARELAASLGTRVHDAATSGKELGDVADDIRPFLRQYKAWLEDSGATILTAERQAWNLSRGYAGSFDLMAMMPDKRVAIIDIKTGKGTYPEHALQVCAYSMAEFVGEDDKVDSEATEWLLDAEVMALLHLRPEGWRWEEVRVDKHLVSAFDGLLAFAKWAHENQKMDGLLVTSEKGAAPK